MFTALDGGPMSPDYLTQTFTQLVKASGLPPARLHDLRHGAASLALAAGVDLKVVADQLGHCSIVLTADTYVSVAVEPALSAAEAVARLVMRAGRRPPGGGKSASPAPRPEPSLPPPDQAGEHLTRRGTRRTVPLPRRPEGPGQRPPGTTAGPPACGQKANKRPTVFD